jgi:hypothetical protein
LPSVVGKLPLTGRNFAFDNPNLKIGVERLSLCGAFKRTPNGGIAAKSD